MSCQILGQLGDAKTSEAWRPLHLAEARLLDGRTIIDDNDVVVATLEIGITNVWAGRKVSATAKAVNDNFGRMRPIEVRIVQGVRIEYVQEFGLFLRSPRIEEELNLWMRTSKRFGQA